MEALRLYLNPLIWALPVITLLNKHREQKIAQSAQPWLGKVILVRKDVAKCSILLVNVKVGEVVI